jgi:DNA-binding transcriptional LysR family regulator
LRAFLTIVQTGSLGRAATRCISRDPRLSRLVKQMESQLRAPLFERRTIAMELTTFGQALSLKKRDLAIEDMNVRLGLAGGTVRIDAVASAKQ